MFTVEYDGAPLNGATPVVDVKMQSGKLAYSLRILESNELCQSCKMVSPGMIQLMGECIPEPVSLMCHECFTMAAESITACNSDSSASSVAPSEQDDYNYSGESDDDFEDQPDCGVPLKKQKK